MMHNNFYNQQAQIPMNYQYPEHLHNHFNDIYNTCVAHMKKKVKIVTVDQQVYQGTIDNVDNNHVYLLLDNGYREEPSNYDERGYGYGSPGYGYGYGTPGYGYGYGSPGFGYGHGFGPGYGGGLGSAILPLATLATVSAL
ncbi:hypothetical protein NC797_15410 [Aquibacillus sp. 3ASR75-11]|uniref:Uncharacterized protein n=1 Tax=Terrihalobacillus insolitus TaxID=2950438 RepID=A0A9X3WUK7_9BACI|nr:hypothetical protein [Terrihalobacillus insolitus]MDC3415275.1 hypothetical protein [Terrihalobacillus insolitus]MDC3425895.1 hypothetical protein [Terrihalobacillus insolitus]